MTTQEVRALVISAINTENFYYSHTLPPSYKDWIDGLAWSQLGRGASLLVGDWELANLFYEYGSRIMSVGKDARNYAPLQVKSDWIPSMSMPGFWFTMKPQSFAGPSALIWANKIAKRFNKPEIPNTFNVTTKAKAMVASGFLFGILTKKISFLREHIDSVWLAHLMLEKKPSFTMKWMTEENPFFAYIYGIKQTVNYPEDMHRTTEGKSEKESKIVPLADCEPSAWIFRRDPYNRYKRLGTPQSDSYTPLAQLVGDYLQMSL